LIGQRHAFDPLPQGVNLAPLSLRLGLVGGCCGSADLMILGEIDKHVRIHEGIMKTDSELIRRIAGKFCK
tara:strand:+ start:193 stop:402 length:210 start_codon:yes stop_codon:yes gene_type:complete